MLAGNYPFEGDTIPLLYKKILSPEKVEYPHTMLKAARQLISGMLVVEPSARLTVAAARKHSFMRSSVFLGSLRDALSFLDPFRTSSMNLRRTASATT